MQVVLKSHTFDFYRNSCPLMNGCYRMQTFEQLQRVRLVPRTAQAGKGVLFQPGYIAAADAELCGNLLLRLRDGAIQAVPQGQNLLLALRQGGNQLAQRQAAASRSSQSSSIVARSGRTSARVSMPLSAPVSSGSCKETVPASRRVWRSCIRSSFSMQRLA